MIESSGGSLSCFQVATVSEGPGPRVGHSSLLVGNAFIVFGGDTKIDENDALDDTLYLLNTCTWARFSVQMPLVILTLNLLSFPPMVSRHPSRASALRTLRPHIEYLGLETLRIRRPGGRLLFQRLGCI